MAKFLRDTGSFWHVQTCSRSTLWCSRINVGFISTDRSCTRQTSRADGSHQQHSQPLVLTSIMASRSIPLREILRHRPKSERPRDAHNVIFHPSTLSRDTASCWVLSASKLVFTSLIGVRRLTKFRTTSRLPQKASQSVFLANSNNKMENFTCSPQLVSRCDTIC